MKYTGCLALLLTIVRTTPTTSQDPSVVSPEEDCSTTCCEEDCCGTGTRWEASASYCIKDSNSPGWTGTYSSEHVAGCALYKCCEANCCSSGDDTMFDVALGYCVPATEAPSSTPSNTVNPSGSSLPSTSASPSEAGFCDPIVALSQMIINTTEANKESATLEDNFSTPPDNWKRIPGTDEAFPNDIGWLYDWEKDGDHNTSGKDDEDSNKIKPWETIIKERSCDDKKDFLTDKEKATACAECKKKESSLKKALCAAFSLKKFLTDRENEKCFHYTIALLSLLKCLDIPADPEVYHKKYYKKNDKGTIVGEVAGHAWVEVKIGGVLYMLDAANGIYVSQGP